ncbi:MAG: ABC transporter ATP-binding protein [Dehalococcoidia bacterium]|nr:ABC transporter ATP-binding protein [Dehalococcoidia bacterium]
MTVEINSVSKHFGNVRAVDNLSLNVAEGEFLVLVGPSGCGKTTALRMVAGLETPTSGVISIGGRDVTFVEPSQRDIAMVFQSYALYPHMTVYDNLAFGLKQRKTSREEIKARVVQAAEMLAIGGLWERKPRELSGGQRQRVALGRAIVRRPSAFLMDEPLSNLDAQLRLKMRAEISALHRRLAATVIYVTHDQVEAMTMGTRIAVLKDGLLQQVAPPQELYDRPANAFVATFIGSPAMNLIPGEIVYLGESVAFVSKSFTMPLPADSVPTDLKPGPVLLGIRPEQFDRQPATGGGGLAGEVRLVEPHGSDLFVTAETGSGDVTARLDPACLVRVGETVVLKPSLSSAYLFDPGTGQRL